ncbi:sugar nucleotide-binding protein, partial [Schleiferiaceae bacterium]|nr:sugar nucleotide-binding protein [Schleiferiaceae bacterium]
MNILVTGSNGQLGSEIKDVAASYKEFSFFFTSSFDLDICNASQVDSYIRQNQINAVINCAAYTAVDKAEDDSENAKKINAQGVLNLVNALENVDGKLIHISTDYVFDGNNFIPYHESDEVKPIGVYGNTKRLGELEVINSGI